MGKIKTKAAKTKKTVNPTIKIDWEGIVADQEFMNMVALLGTLLARRPRRPCVRQQVLNTMSAVATLLLALDGEYPKVLNLLDGDCLGGSITGEVVKPVKRKKRVGRR